MWLLISGTFATQILPVFVTVALQLKANDGAEKQAGFSHMLLCFVFNLYFSFLNMQVHPSPFSLLFAS
jgi:hypothetical protein